MISMEVKEINEAKEIKDQSQKVGPIRRYSDLLVYKQAYTLALSVSKFTKSLPREEQFEIGRQLRRSARSVAANIVEGWTKRNSPAEFKRHLLIASGEAAETRFWIELTVDEGLTNRKAAEDLLKEYAKLGFMIHNLWKEWRKL
jgi:four helix bundle protein